MITLLFLLSILFLLELMIAVLEGEWDLVYYVFITSFTDVCLSFINLSSACQVFQVLRCHLHRPEEVVPGALWSCSALQAARLACCTHVFGFFFTIFLGFHFTSYLCWILFFLSLEVFLFLFSLCWFFVASQGFLSLCRAGAALQLWCVASHCRGFSCFRSQAAGHAGFSSLSTWAQKCCVGLVACGMWNILGVGMEPVSLALSGGFLTSGLLGKSGSSYF